MGLFMCFMQVKWNNTHEWLRHSFYLRRNFNIGYSYLSFELEAEFKLVLPTRRAWKTHIWELIEMQKYHTIQKLVAL